MNASRFAAVVFDCDGVLVDSEHLVIEALSSVFSRLGAPYDATTHCTRFLGREARETFAVLAREYQERYARPLPADFWQQCLAEFRAVADVELKEVAGARRSIQQLGIPVAVASSSNRSSLVWKLEKAGLLDLFSDHVYASDDVARHKPAPDVYLHAAAKLGVDPASCLVVEDSETGVTAGRAAGMTVWGFMGGRHLCGRADTTLKAAGAERILNDWASLMRLLR